ncbi:MAG: hypothetical protein DRI89_13290 [Bacteroidetes bacterium]|nr:MAG: hypothetical protein DRI89_13290 [Bacteroidota bacterium]
MSRHIHIVLILVLFIITSFAQAQKKSRVHVEKADKQVYDESFSKEIERLIGLVVMRQEDTRFYCDSAYLNTQKRNFEAFGNVHIAVNDTVDVYGNRMLYNGDTRVAELFGDVRLVEKSTILTTEHLIYNRISKIAFYDVGGTIVNGDNTLTSKRGYYNTESKIFYFRKDVVLINPDSETYSDTLIYNTINETAYFEGPTVIRGNESAIYCEAGWYDTQHDFSKLSKRPFISGSEQTITADSILYDNFLSSGKAFGNVEILDTLHKVVITGKYGEMWDKEGRSFITDSVIAITYDETDSMFIHSDTMWMYFDKKRNAKKLLAYYSVRFFRSQMQGICDSMVYTMNDSTIRFLNEPVLWSEKNQLTADSINIFVAGNRVDSLMMYNTAFIVSRDSTDSYNQIRGKNMTGYFKDNELAKISVDGNAQTIYYIREEDGYLIGINLSESSTMDIRLLNSEMNAISYQTKAVEKMFPEKDFPANQKTLKGFSWQETLRPRDKHDIFRVQPTVSTEQAVGDGLQ